MSFLNRMLASVGIGSAKIDTQLDNAAVRLGDDLSGRVVVKGGNVAQEVEFINLFVMTRIKSDDTYMDVEVARVGVSGALQVAPGSTQSIEFRAQLPYEVPMSLPGTTVWLQTGAAIAAAVDPSDRDHLQVLPNAPVEALMRGAERLGLQLRRTEVERAHGRIVQELEYHPPYGFGITEVEMVLFPGRDRVEVILEADRRARGVASLFVSEFESRARWSVTPDLIARGPDAIANELGNRIRSL